VKNKSSIPPEVFCEGARLREEEGLSVPQIVALLGYGRKSWEHQLRKGAVFKGGRPPARLPRVSEHDHTIERLRIDGLGGERIGRAIGKCSGYVAQRLTFIAYRQAVIDAWEELGMAPPSEAGPHQQRHTSVGEHRHDQARPGR